MLKKGVVLSLVIVILLLSFVNSTTYYDIPDYTLTYTTSSTDFDRCADETNLCAERTDAPVCTNFVSESAVTTNNLCSIDAGCIFPTVSEFSYEQTKGTFCEGEEIVTYDQELLLAFHKAKESYPNQTFTLNDTFLGFDYDTCHALLCNSDTGNNISGTIAYPNTLTEAPTVRIKLLPSSATSSRTGFVGVIEQPDPNKKEFTYTISGLPDRLVGAKIVLEADGFESQIVTDSPLKETYDFNLQVQAVEEFDINLNFFGTNDAQITTGSGLITIINSNTLEQIQKDFSQTVTHSLTAGTYTIKTNIDGYYEKTSQITVSESNTFQINGIQKIQDPKTITINVIDQNNNPRNAKLYFTSKEFNHYVKAVNGAATIQVPAEVQNGKILAQLFKYADNAVTYDSTIDEYTIKLNSWAVNSCSQYGAVLYLKSELITAGQYCSASNYFDIFEYNITRQSPNGGEVITEDNIDDYICCKDPQQNLIEYKDTDFDGVIDNLDICPTNPFIQTESDPLYGSEIEQNAHDGVNFCSDGFDNDCDGQIDNDDSDCVEQCTINDCRTDTKQYCTNSGGIKQLINQDNTEFDVVDYCANCQERDSAYCADQIDGLTPYICCPTTCTPGGEYSDPNNAICSSGTNVCNIGACAVVDACVQNKYFKDIKVFGDADTSCLCGGDIVDYTSPNNENACCFNGQFVGDCSIHLDIYKIQVDFYDSLSGVPTRYLEPVQMIIKSDADFIRPFTFSGNLGGKGEIVNLDKGTYTLTFYADERSPVEVELTPNDFIQAQDNTNLIIEKDVVFNRDIGGACSNNEPIVLFNVSAISGSPNANLTWTNPCINQTGLVTHYLIRRTNLNKFDFSSVDRNDVYSQIVKRAFDASELDGFLPMDYAGEYVALIPNDEFELNESNEPEIDEFGNNVYKRSFEYIDQLDDWGIDYYGNKNSYIYEIRAFYAGNRYSPFALPAVVKDYRTNLEIDNTFTNVEHLSERFGSDNYYELENAFIGSNRNDQTQFIGISRLSANTDIEKRRSNYLTNLKYKVFNSGTQVCTYYAGEFCAEYLDDNYAYQNQGLLNDYLFNGKLNKETIKSLLAQYATPGSMNNVDALRNLPSVIVSCNEFNFPERINQEESSICFRNIRGSNDRYPLTCAINAEDSNDAECIKLPDLLNDAADRYRQNIITDTKLGFGFNKTTNYNEKHENFDPLAHMDSNKLLYTTFDRGFSVYDRWVSCSDALIPLNVDDTSRESGCYGYQSEDACTQNACGFGSQGTCTWRESGAGGISNELSKGYCFDSEPVVNACDLSNLNQVYSYGNVTQEICSDLGNCYLGRSEDDDVCRTCGEFTTCSDYKSELACVGNNPTTQTSQNFEINGGFKINQLGSTISKDACGIGNCVWAGFECQVDKNYDGLPDEDEIVYSDNLELESHINLINEKEFVFSHRSDYPDGNKNALRVTSDINGFVSSNSKLTSIAFRSDENGFELLNGDEYNSLANVYDEVTSSEAAVASRLLDDAHVMSLLNSGDATSSKVRIIDDLNVGPRAKSVELAYMTIDDNGLITSKNTRKVMYDNQAPNITITYNELNSDGKTHDIIIIRDVDELTFDSNGNRQECDEQLEFMEYGGSDFTVIEGDRSDRTFSKRDDFVYQSSYSYDGLSDGIYRFKSSCTDLAGNYGENEINFILFGDILIKSMYPKVGEVVPGLEQDFAIELFRRAKSCNYELYFNNQIVDQMEGDDLFNSPFTYTWSDFEYSNQGVLEKKENQQTSYSPFVCNQDSEPSVACITNEGTYLLNSTFSSASTSSQITVDDYRTKQTGVVFINATCLIQNGTELNNFIEKTFPVTQFYIDRMQPETELITIPGFAVEKNSWLNYNDLKAGAGKLSIGFECNDYPSIDQMGTAAGCSDLGSNYAITDYESSCIGLPPTTFAANSEIKTGIFTSIDSSATICYQSVDNVGNLEELNEIKFQIDTDFPQINFSGIKSSAAGVLTNLDNPDQIVINDYMNGDYTTLNFKLNDQTTNISRISLFADRGNGAILLDELNLNNPQVSDIKIKSNTANNNIEFEYEYLANDNVNDFIIEVEDYARNVIRKHYYLFNDKIAPSLKINYGSIGRSYLDDVVFDLILIDNDGVEEFGKYKFENTNVLTKLNLNDIKIHNFTTNDTVFENKDEVISLFDSYNNYFNSLDFNTFHEYGDFAELSALGEGKHEFTIESRESIDQVHGLIPGIYNLTIEYSDKYANSKSNSINLTINPSNIIDSTDLSVALNNNLVTPNNNYDYTINSNKLLGDVNSFYTVYTPTIITHTAYVGVEPDFDTILTGSGESLGMALGGEYNLPTSFIDANIPFTKEGVMDSNYRNGKFRVNVDDIFGTTYEFTLSDEIAIDFKGPTEFSFYPNLQSTLDIYPYGRFRYYNSEFGLVTNKANFYVSGLAETFADEAEINWKSQTKSGIDLLNPSTYHQSESFRVNSEVQNTFRSKTLITQPQDIVFDNKYLKDGFTDPDFLQNNLIENVASHISTGKELTTADYIQRQIPNHGEVELYANSRYPLSYYKEYNLNTFEENNELPDYPVTYQFDLRSFDGLKNPSTYLSSNNLVRSDGFDVTYDGKAPAIEINFPRDGDYIVTNNAEFSFSFEEALAIDNVVLNIVRMREGYNELILSESFNNIDDNLNRVYSKTQIEADGNYFYNLTVMDVAGNYNTTGNVNFFIIRGAPHLIYSSMGGNTVERVEYINNEINPDLVLDFAFANPESEFGFNVSDVYLQRKEGNTWITLNTYQTKVDFSAPTNLLYDTNNRLNYFNVQNFTFYLENDDFNALSSGAELSESEYRLHFKAEKGKRVHTTYYNFSFTPIPLEAEYYHYFTLDTTNPLVDFDMPAATNDLSFDYSAIIQEINLDKVIAQPQLYSIRMNSLAAGGTIGQAELENIPNNNEEIEVDYAISLIDKALNTNEYEFTILYDRKIPNFTISTQSFDDNTIALELGKWFTNNEKFNVTIKANELIDASLIVEQQFGNGWLPVRSINNFATLNENSILSGIELDIRDFAISYNPDLNTYVRFRIIGNDHVGNEFEEIVNFVFDKEPPIITNFMPLSAADLTPNFKFNTDEFADCRLEYQDLDSSNLVGSTQLSDSFVGAHSYQVEDNMTTIQRATASTNGIEVELLISCTDKRGNSGINEITYTIDYSIPQFGANLVPGICSDASLAADCIDYMSYLIEEPNEESGYDTNLTYHNIEITKLSEEASCYYLNENDLNSYNVSNDAFQIVENVYGGDLSGLTNLRIQPNSNWKLIDETAIELSEGDIHNFIITCVDNSNNPGYAKVISADVEFDSIVSIYFGEYNPITNKEEHEIKFQTTKDAVCLIDGSGTDSEQKINGIYHYTANVVLEEGENEFEIECTPKAPRGEVGSATYNIVLDTTAPEIAINSESEIFTNEYLYNLDLTVNELSDLIITNGMSEIEYELNGNVQFATPLDIGANYIVVQAVDKAGNSAQTSLKVTRNSGGYSTTIISNPGANAIVNSFDSTKAYYLGDVNTNNSLLLIRDLTNGAEYANYNGEICLRAVSDESQYDSDPITFSDSDETLTLQNNGVVLTSAGVSHPDYAYIIGDFLELNGKIIDHEIILEKDIDQIKSINILGREYLAEVERFEDTLTLSLVYGDQEIELVDGLFDNQFSKQDDLYIKFDVSIIGQDIILNKIDLEYNLTNPIYLMVGQPISSKVDIIGDWDFVYQGSNAIDDLANVGESGEGRYRISNEEIDYYESSSESYSAAFGLYQNTCTNYQYNTGQINNGINSKEYNIDLFNGNYQIISVPVENDGIVGIPSTIVFSVDSAVPEIERISPISVFLNKLDVPIEHRIKSNGIKSANYYVNNQNQEAEIARFSDSYTHLVDADFVDQITNTFELEVTDSQGNYATTGKQQFTINSIGFDNPNLFFSELHEEFDLNDDCRLKCGLKGFSKSICNARCSQVSNNKLAEYFSIYGFSEDTLFGDKSNTRSRDDNIRNFLETWYSATDVEDFVDYSGYSEIELSEYEGGINSLSNKQIKFIGYKQDLDIELLSVEESVNTLIVNYTLYDGFKFLQLSDYLIYDEKYYFDDHQTYLNTNSFTDYSNNLIYNYRLKYNEILG